MKKAQVIHLQEQSRSRRKQSRIVNLDGFKYFSKDQIRLLRRTARDQATLDKAKGKVTGILRRCAVGKPAIGVCISLFLAPLLQ